MKKKTKIRIGIVGISGRMGKSIAIEDPRRKPTKTHHRRPLGYEKNMKPFLKSFQTKQCQP